MKIKRWIYNTIIVCASAETVLQVDACLTCHYSRSQNTPPHWQLTAWEKKPLIWKDLCHFSICTDICGVSQIIIMIIKIYFRELHKTYTNRMLSFLCIESTSVLWHISFQSRMQMGLEWCVGFALSFAREWVPWTVWRYLSEWTVSTY